MVLDVQGLAGSWRPFIEIEAHTPRSPHGVLISTPTCLSSFLSCVLSFFFVCLFLFIFRDVYFVFCFIFSALFEMLLHGRTMASAGKRKNKMLE